MEERDESQFKFYATAIHSIHSANTKNASIAIIRLLTTQIHKSRRKF